MINEAKLLDSGDIIQISHTIYTHDLILKAHTRFIEYKEKGIILKGDFNSNSWWCKDILGLPRISFDVENIIQERLKLLGVSITEFKNIIRCYAAMLFGTIVLTSIRERINTVLKLVSAYKVELNTQEYGYIEEFLDFLQLNEEEIEDVLNLIMYKNYKRGKRKMANFIVYFLFEKSINMFWEEASHENKLKYFPLYFWVNVTFRIPLRVTEMLVTSYNCWEKDEYGNAYKLRLYRTKLKQGTKVKKVSYLVEDDYYQETFIIKDEKIIDAIKYYQKGTCENVRDFLFDSEYGRKSHNKKYSRDILYDLLEEYYNNYFQKTKCFNFEKYVCGINEFEKIRIGDSRVLALINLRLFGASMVDCKKLAGHANINTTDHYFSNLDDYIKGMSLLSYKRLRNKRQLEYERQIKGAKEDLIDECTSKTHRLDPNNVEDCIKMGCLENCVGCSYRVVSKKQAEIEFKSFERQLQDETKSFRVYIEKIRGIKGFDNTMESIILSIQNKAQQYSSAFIQKVRKDEETWEE